MRNLFNVLTVIFGILMILTVLIQTRGQSLGASFGGDSNFYRSKRGAEAVIFNATIVFAVIFVLSVILSILAKK
ncbi:MAG TPA: preprotein translocase subunit SecG [Candidatus Saccharimonadia bacterium]|nr:preprotein translocase subunit SecG [Candidatus Saccharimonadia bacterium]